MSRFKSGYNGYRGRRTLNDILRLVAIVLTVLVVLLLAALLFGQRFLVYTDNGLHMQLPFSKQEEQKPLEPGDISVVIRPAGSQSEESGEAAEVLEEDPVLAALELPLESVLNGTALQELEEAGANALILEMKSPDGLLAWQSEQPMAAQAKVNSGREGINETLRQWNAGGVHTIARVCCFRDDSLPYQRNEVALRAGYGNWRDELGLRWLDPDSEAARTYLAQLCGELAQLGFDEILLECAAFPTRGNLESIVSGASFASGQFEEVTGAFLEQVSAVLEPYDTVLAVRVERASLTGEDAQSGLTANVLESWADRLWLKEDAARPELLELLTTSGIQEPDKRLVRLISDLGQGDGGPSAVLTEND